MNLFKAMDISLVDVVFIFKGKGKKRDVDNYSPINKTIY